MEINHFKDKLFDLISESDELDVADIETEDRKDLFTVTMGDGSVFRVICEAA